MINGEKHKISRISVGNLYDLNKDLVEKETKPLTQEELAIKKEMVHNFLINNEAEYYMLLCNEKKDYTVFNLLNMNEMFPAEDEVPNILIDECLKNRGEIRSIELTANKDAIEI